jgi:phosphoribosylglycinamide formyltransferase-1
MQNTPPVQIVGLITYQYPHLKTEQILQRILRNSFEYKMFALPFVPRDRHKTLFEHRPEQTDAIAPEILAEKHNIPYIACRSDRDIDNSCDLYLILGAGILSEKCVEGKKIINCHPGIIPACRGLDSFKWAIYSMRPLGVTLHYIDARVDAGEIITVMPTNIYKTDSLATLARRHYENEISCISDFALFLTNPQNPFSMTEAAESKRRMSIERERELVRRFSDYTEKFGQS